MLTETEEKRETVRIACEDLDGVRMDLSRVFTGVAPSPIACAIRAIGIARDYLKMDWETKRGKAVIRG